MLGEQGEYYRDNWYKLEKRAPELRRSRTVWDYEMECVPGLKEYEGEHFFKEALGGFENLS